MVIVYGFTSVFSDNKEPSTDTEKGLMEDRVGSFGKSDVEDSAEEDKPGEISLIGEDYILNAGEVVYEKISVIDGDVRIIGVAYGDISVIGGSLVVDGIVNANIYVIDGDLKIRGTVNGDVKMWGGSYDKTGIVTGEENIGEGISGERGFVERFFTGTPFEGLPVYLLWLIFIAGLILIFIFVLYILGRIGARYNRIKRERSLEGYKPRDEHKDDVN
jgi:hypothetical protein